MPKFKFMCHTPGPITKRRRRVANILTVICSPVGMVAVNATIKQRLLNNLLWHLGLVPGIVHGLLLIRDLPELTESEILEEEYDELVQQLEEAEDVQQAFKDLQSIYTDYDDETLI
ncbi:hypothetical protein DFJ63DRAFT_335617 [Scheffersomyces coipomensis]|uniref:uncharacterized protein n=1 Tax=Scheffersomyces coipomensis TaxID=1788519 RepID=UPI00315C929A